MAELLRDSVYRALRHAVLTCEFSRAKNCESRSLLKSTVSAVHPSETRCFVLSRKGL
jgi:hypothetical protein